MKGYVKFALIGFILAVAAMLVVWAADPGHPASDIGQGTFETGNYTISGNFTVGSPDTPILLVDNSSKKVTIHGRVNATNYSASRGTVGIPSYSFSDDGDIGMYSAGGNSLDFSVAGARMLSIQDNHLAPQAGIRLQDSISNNKGYISSPSVHNLIDFRDQNSAYGIRMSTSSNSFTSPLVSIIPQGYSVGPGYGTTQEQVALSITARTQTNDANYTTQRTTLMESITYSAYTAQDRGMTDAYTVFVNPPITGGGMTINNTYALGAGAATTIKGIAQSRYAAITIPAHTVTTNTTTQMTQQPAVSGVRIEQITIAQAQGAVTVDNAASLYIDAAPIGGASVTITNPYGLWVNATTRAGNITMQSQNGSLNTIWHNGTGICISSC